MIRLKQILVATDFGEPSESALIYGRALARNFGATLHVVHVVGNVSSALYSAEGYIVSVPELQQEVDDAARKQLDGLLVDNDTPPLPTRAVLITSNSPALAIVDYAETGTHRPHRRPAHTAAAPSHTC